MVGSVNSNAAIISHEQSSSSANSFRIIKRVLSARPKKTCSSRFMRRLSIPSVFFLNCDRRSLGRHAPAHRSPQAVSVDPGLTQRSRAIRVRFQINTFKSVPSLFSKMKTLTLRCECLTSRSVSKGRFINDKLGDAELSNR